MSDGKNQNDNLVVLNVNNYAIIPDSVSPQASKITRQAFSESARIFCRCYAFIKIFPDSFRCSPVKGQ